MLEYRLTGIFGHSGPDRFRTSAVRRSKPLGEGTYARQSTSTYKDRCRRSYRKYHAIRATSVPSTRCRRVTPLWADNHRNHYRPYGSRTNANRIIGQRLFPGSVAASFAMTSETAQTLCPSAQPEMAGAIVLGVVRGTPDTPRLGYLTQSLPVTAAVLEMASPVKSTEVLRFAAPCAGSACRHFDGTDCQLARRIVDLLPAVAENLPPCRVRPNCRWWQQEGRAACKRCPQIVTESEPQDQRLVEASGVTITDALL
jgi:hypothetical protein